MSGEQLVTKRYTTETGHRLMLYQGKCAHLHGHRYIWELGVVGEVRENGIIVDFKIIKRAMEEILGPLDHALALWDVDPLVTFFQSESAFCATDGTPQRLCVCKFNPTAENFSKHFGGVFQQWFVEHGIPVNVEFLKVWETEDSFACYLPLG